MRVFRAAVLIGALSPACATETALRLYQGPPRPSSEIAFLRNKAGYLWSIDGVKPRCGICHATSLELLPGTHTVSVEIGDAGTGLATRPAAASFEAIAGHTYELSARINVLGAAAGTDVVPPARLFGWTPVIEDVTFGTTVFP